MSNPYESTKLVSEYLFFHYASPEAVADGMPVPHEALDFSGPPCLRTPRCERPSWDVLRETLDPDFQLDFSKDMPFLIREHRRKFQLGISLSRRAEIT